MWTDIRAAISNSIFRDRSDNSRAAFVMHLDAPWG
jgi:hypothetical protein